MGDLTYSLKILFWIRQNVYMEVRILTWKKKKKKT